MPTNNVQLKRGTAAAFASLATKDSNTIYFITDTNRLFVGDSEYTRPVQHGSELPTSKNPANSLFVKETGTSRELYYSKDGTAWDMIAYLPATITGGVFGDNTAGTVAYGGTVKVPKVTVDNRGYVTAAEDVTITLPTSDKVTTVTTSGDGNAVTGGNISNDGATLTLTKGESFVPADGGTFTGDVTVSGDLTADCIKSAGEITITPTTNVTLNGTNRQTHDNSKITFVNTNKVNNDEDISIEASYTADVSSYAGHMSDISKLKLKASNVFVEGKLTATEINSLTFNETYDNGDTIYTIKPILATVYDNNPRLEFRYELDYPETYTNIVLNSDFISLNGEVSLSKTPTHNNHAATKKYVDDSISSSVAASDAMVFKGTVGTSGTVASFSAINVSSATKGDTYKVITADTLPAASSFDSAAHDLTPGDLIVYMGESKFIYVPSGDEDATSVKVAGSGDTINVSTTAQTGNLVLGTAAGVNTASTVTNDSATVPTTAAVKTYVDNAVSAAALTWGTI